MYAPSDARQDAAYAKLPGSVYGCGAHGDSLWRGQFAALARGKWNDVCMRVRLNTFDARTRKPNCDGLLRLEINGTVRQYDRMVWRTQPSGAPVAGIIFHTFFGGSDPSWATPRTVTAWFSDVSVSVTSKK